jgi:hypothetical protein
LGKRPCSFISRNICFEFSVQCLCRVSLGILRQNFAQLNFSLHFRNFNVVNLACVPSVTPSSYWTAKIADFLPSRVSSIPLCCAGFHQNGGGPPRAVSPMSVDGGPASKPSLSAAGGRGGGGGNEGRGSPSPSLVSEKTLTEAELQVSLHMRHAPQSIFFFQYSAFVYYNLDWSRSQPPCHISPEGNSCPPWWEYTPPPC